MSALRTTVRLFVEEGPDRFATWPASDTDGGAAADAEIPVVHGGQRLGSITVQMPVGRALRGRDMALLDDLAEQAGLAFRNAQLSAELSGRVAQLSHRNGELSDSRRRLITAGDAERSRLERSIARQVVPHLSPLPDRLDELARTGPGGLHGSRLTPLVASVTVALEELREITRGVFPAQLSRSGLQPALGRCWDAATPATWSSTRR